MFVVAVTVVEFWFDSAAAGDRTVYSSNLELGKTCFEAPLTTYWGVFCAWFESVRPGCCLSECYVDMT